MTGAVVSNIILMVEDVGRAVAFYRDTLGLRVRAAVGAFAFLDGGGTTLVLRQSDGPLPAETDRVEVVLEVDDPEATYRQWVDAGVRFRVELRPVNSTDDRDLVAADFRDPDGNLLSLTGWVPRVT